jgi:hypothetical protein
LKLSLFEIEIDGVGFAFAVLVCDVGLRGVLFLIFNNEGFGDVVWNFHGLLALCIFGYFVEVYLFVEEVF